MLTVRLRKLHHWTCAGVGHGLDASQVPNHSGRFRSLHQFGQVRWGVGYPPLAFLIAVAWVLARSCFSVRLSVRSLCWSLSWSSPSPPSLVSSGHCPFSARLSLCRTEVRARLARAPSKCCDPVAAEDQAWQSPQETVGVEDGLLAEVHWLAMGLP